MWSSTLLCTGSLRITAHWRNEWKLIAQPNLHTGGEGSSAVGNGGGCCKSWLFLMTGQKNPKQSSNEGEKSHSLHQPSPPVELLLGTLLPSVVSSLTSDCPRRPPLLEHTYCAAECQSLFLQSFECGKWAPVTTRELLSVSLEDGKK